MTSMKFKLKPYPHQMYAIDMAKEKGNIGLFWDMGCLSGESTVKINRGKGCRTYTMEELYFKQNNTFSDKLVSKCRSFLGDRIGLHDIAKVVYSGVKETFTLTLENGNSIRATGNHEIMTDRGWVPMDSLLDTDYVMTDTPLPKAHKVRKPRNRYSLNQVGEFYPHAQYFMKDGVKLFRGLKHRLIFEAALNGLTLEELKEATYRKNDLKFIDPKLFHIHHKDHDHRNNDIGNLECLPVDDHLKIHGKVEHFYQGTPVFSKVVSVEVYGMEDTYDIVCEDPHRNFVSNNIVVHNSGKTGGVINIIRNLYAKKQKIRKTLILSPAVTLYNWQEEFQIHSYVPKERVHVLSKGGSKGKIREFLKYALNSTTQEMDGEHIFITNYESMNSKELFDFIMEWGPEIVVLDEAHYIKNPKAKRSKAIIKLGDKTPHKFILTGTPILNSIQDIFNLFRFLDGGATFGRNFHVFKHTYMEDENAAWSGKQGHFPKMVARSETYGILTDKIYTKCHRVLKKDVLKDLPPLVKTTRLIEMSPEMKKHYKLMERDFVTFVESKEKSGESAAVVAQLAVTKALRLQQICTGILQTEEGEVLEIAKNPRLDLVKELLQEIVVDGKNKCILWCSFKHNYKQLSRVCEELGIKHNFITGEQNLEEKQKAMEEFNNGDASVIIANRRAGGIGVNLIAAAYSIVYSRNFSLGEELQSEARNYRGGSQIHEQIVKIDLAAKDTVDEKVLEALKNKDDISKKIIDVIRR